MDIYQAESKMYFEEKKKIEEHVIGIRDKVIDIFEEFSKIQDVLDDLRKTKDLPEDLLCKIRKECNETDIVFEMRRHEFFNIVQELEKYMKEI